MWTQTPVGHKLIHDISKDLVMDFAPEEMDLFDELVVEYFHDPTPPDFSAKPVDDPLAFGLDEVLVAVTPAAAAMVHAVLNHLMAESLNVAKEEGAEAVRKKIRGIFKNEEQQDEKPVKKDNKEIRPLNREQMEQVKKLARKQAIQFGIKPDKAEKMANALIGALALK
jgi:hypothetical protein